MIEAYLQVMKVRMAHRLNFELNLPKELSSIEVPSMILLTLAENAIKHGLEPSIAGGKIEIVARVEDADVVLEVIDTGVGLNEQPGNGLGLRNVRDRLQLMFGEGAVFNITENLEGGVCAEVRLQAMVKTLKNEGKV
jgi:LytS/YehU family sensor histidine kinase